MPGPSADTKFVLSTTQMFKYTVKIKIMIPLRNPMNVFVMGNIFCIKVPLEFPKQIHVFSTTEHIFLFDVNVRL